MQNNIQDDVILMDALKGIADGNNKVDLKIIQLLFDQKKKLLICKLRDKVNTITKHVRLVKNCYENICKQASVYIIDFSDASPTTSMGQ